MRRAGLLDPNAPISYGHMNVVQTVDSFMFAGSAAFVRCMVEFRPGPLCGACGFLVPLLRGTMHVCPRPTCLHGWECKNADASCGVGESLFTSLLLPHERCWDGRVTFVSPLGPTRLSAMLSVHEEEGIQGRLRAQAFPSLAQSQMDQR
jgi:hypothetical protein